MQVSEAKWVWDSRNLSFIEKDFHPDLSTQLTYEGWLGALRGAELRLLALAAGGVEGRAPGALAEAALRTPASREEWNDGMCRFSAQTQLDVKREILSVE